MASLSELTIIPINGIELEVLNCF